MLNVGIAILVGVVLYTVATFGFRKPGPAYEPFAEGRHRQETARLIAAGWQRFPATFSIEKAGATPEAQLPEIENMLPAALTSLRENLLEEIHLPVAYTKAHLLAAAAEVAQCEIAFEVELDGARAALVGFEVFRKEGDVLLLPRWQPAPTGQVAAKGTIRFSLAPLPAPATYRVLLPALKASSRFSLVRRE